MTTGTYRHIKVIELRGTPCLMSYSDNLLDEDGNEVWGLCYSSNHIALSSKVTGIVALDTAIHEALHACLPDVGEEAVAETATSIAKMLSKMGVKWGK